VTAVYYRWLDRWDEGRARRGDDVKNVTDLALDPELVFSGESSAAGLDAFCVMAEAVTSDAERFFAPPGLVADASIEDEWIHFTSSAPTGIPSNDVVLAKLTRAGSFDHAVVVFHHWNATSRNRALARYLARQGIAVVEIALPYHLERSRPGASFADHMLSANLGRTLQSVRQAVLDGRQLIGILQRAGYRRVSVLGMSLGSWVAGLVAAQEHSVQKASLLLCAGSLADMVWSGAATRHIRAGLEGRAGLSDLRRAWSPLDLGSHATSLARPGLSVQIVLAKRDRVVLPELSETFVQQLQRAGASPQVMELNCGHYSLALPPYAIRLGISLSRFLRGG